jgi:SAM-dependent methyltransferase
MTMAQDSSRPDFWDTRYDNQVMPWDAGGVPARFAAHADALAPGARILVPGCGAGYEACFLASRGFDVLAIDFSAPAVALAKSQAGAFAHCFVEADFFTFDAGAGFDVVYERAFLCALPRRMENDYAARMAQLIPSGGALVGYWFFDDNLRGPPFGTTVERLDAMLSPAFLRESDESVTDSLPVFAAKERWQVWRRR